MVTNSFTFGSSPDRNHTLHADQLLVLYQALPYSVLMNILAVMLMVAVQWTVIPHATLIGWASAAIAVSMLRYVNYRLYLRRDKLERNTGHWLSRNIAGVILAGSVWGSAAYFLFPPENLPHQMAVVLMLTGLAAAGMTTLSVCTAAIVSYLLLTLVPLIIQLFAQHTEAGALLGVMVVLYLITIVIASLKFHNNIFALFNSKYDVEQAQTELQLAAAAFEGNEGIFITDTRARIMKANHAVTRITGYEEHELLGKTPQLFSSGRHDEKFYTQMWQSIVEEGSWSGEIWNRRKDGTIYPQRLTVTAVKDDSKNDTFYVGHFNDISKQKESEKQILYQAHYDALTDLPNRRAFSEQLRQGLGRMSRSGDLGALVYMDLDAFKEINDSYGHHIGDELLKIVAGKLRETLRTEDTAGRLGGDEFVALLGELGTDIAMAELKLKKMLRRLIGSIAGEYTIEDHKVCCAVSIGAVIVPSPRHSEEELLIMADRAMYDAKRSGRGQYCIIRPDDVPATAALPHSG